MGLKNMTAVLSTSNADIYVCGVGIEAVVHSCVFGNNGATAEKVFVSIRRSVTGYTHLVASANVEPYSVLAWPSLINLTPGDKLILRGSLQDAIAVTLAILEDDSTTSVSYAFNPMGVYASGTTYGINDVVSYSGSTYLSRVAANIANTPSSSPASWMVFSVGDASGIPFTPTASISSTNVQTAVEEVNNRNDFTFCLVNS